MTRDVVQIRIAEHRQIGPAFARIMTVEQPADLSAAVQRAAGEALQRQEASRLGLRVEPQELVERGAQTLAGEVAQGQPECFAHSVILPSAMKPPWHVPEPKHGS